MMSSGLFHLWRRSRLVETPENALLRNDTVIKTPTAAKAPAAA
jgi:hypothetical protein